jgi:hypothetical protein
MNMLGHGKVALVPTGWKGDGATGGDNVKLDGPRGIRSHMNSRAYFAETCTAGEYDHKQYLKLDLLGKTMRYTTDLSGAGCGCNAALYLTSMGHNEHKSECYDFYCDANNVCGESCAEIDIEEANQYAWHSTLHTPYDHEGKPGGYGGGGPGWNGPRDWTKEDFGPRGKCISTTRPFDVTVSFPVNASGILDAMVVTLSQIGTTCQLSVSVNKYAGNAELTKALKKGMTPIVSYWGSDDMTWMDGEGDDGNGPCPVDNARKCGDSVRFFDFVVTDIHIGELTKAKQNIEAQERRYSTSTSTSTSTFTPTSTTTTKPWLLMKDPAWTPKTNAERDGWWQQHHSKVSVTMQKYRLGEIAAAMRRWPSVAIGTVILALVVLGMASMLLAVRRRRMQTTTQAPNANEAGSANLPTRSRHASSCALMDMGASQDLEPVV